MKKKRRYLKDLIPVSVNELVLATRYFELQIGDKLLSDSLRPSRYWHNCCRSAHRFAHERGQVIQSFIADRRGVDNAATPMRPTDAVRGAFR